MDASLEGRGRADAGPAPLKRATDWIARRGRWSRGGLALVAGALLTLGHAPVDFPWAFFFAVPVLIWLLDAAPAGRGAFWTGWCAGFGYFVTGLHWVGHAFLVDAEQFLWLMPFAVTLLPLGLGLFWGLAFWLAHRSGARGPWLAAALAAALTLTEFARGHVLTGFPWALPGYVWVETPVMQAASWAGPWGMILITIVLTGLPLTALARGHWPVAAAAALGVAALWVAGAIRLPAETAYSADAPSLRIVQPNAAQELKWREPWATEFFERLIRISSEPAPERPEIVIWPETAVTFLPAGHPQGRARIAAAGGTRATIFGALHAETAGGRDVFYNSLFALGPDGAILARYDKHHLVPFGEYLPLSRVLGALGLTQLAERGGFATGPGPQLVELPGLPGFAPLICYELIFPGKVIPEAGRPDWILQITNDAWFGTFAGPQQHFAQARIRAIEFGIPVVRAANTGISAVIDPHGRIVTTIGLNNIGIRDNRLPAKIPSTTYSRIGDMPVLSLCVILWVFAFYYLKTRPGR